MSVRPSIHRVRNRHRMTSHSFCKTFQVLNPTGQSMILDPFSSHFQGVEYHFKSPRISHLHPVVSCMVARSRKREEETLLGDRTVPPPKIDWEFVPT